MKIHVHDFSGHPFQAQLSRSLAACGHSVEHSYATQYISGKGNLSCAADDPSNLRFKPVTVSARFSKYSFTRRTWFEWSFHDELLRALISSAPDVVILCNLPLLALKWLAKGLRKARIPYVLWHQDVYSVAMAKELQRRLPTRLAALGSNYLARAEGTCVKNAAAVIAIDPSFAEWYREWGVANLQIHIVRNWAPLDEIEPTIRQNQWAIGKSIPADRVRLIYAGTLGRKHNPSLLLDLHVRLVELGLDADMTVISEGEGAEMIREASLDDNSVRVLPFQSADELSDALGAADFLVAILEPDASQFSVPSKVLSYLAAGRPIIGLMPIENSASLAIREAGSLVASPTTEGIECAARWIVSVVYAEGRLDVLGRESRAFAERYFDITEATRRVETVLLTVPT